MLDIKGMIEPLMVEAFNNAVRGRTNEAVESVKKARSKLKNFSGVVKTEDSWKNAYMYYRVAYGHIESELLGYGDDLESKVRIYIW